VRFFEQAHIKDVTAHLKFVVNPRDELSFKRIVQLLAGIGAKGADKLWREFNSCRSAGGQDAAGSRAPIATALQAVTRSVPKKARMAWAQFSATLAQLEEASPSSTAGGLMTLVVDAGYEDYLKANYENYPSRLDDLKQLGIFSEQFETLQEFLAQLALLTNLEAEEAEPADRDTERLRLSTVHQAKGLEFDVVFVIMLCDGLFPSARSLDSEEGEEEERRLMYVAVTRARDELYLSYPLIRAMAGGGMDQMQRPSRFLREISDDLCEEWDLVNGAHRGWGEDPVEDDGTADPDW